MKLKKKTEPLYYQLEQVLRKSILKGEFKPGQAMPAERELCDKYGVSRITVRQALMALEKDDLIHREQGRGTFVTERGRNNIPLKLYGTIEDLFGLGAQTHIEIKSRKLLKANKEIQDNLQLEPGSKVYHYVGTRDFGQGGKSMFQVWLPRDIGEKLPVSELDGPLIIEKVEASALEIMQRAHQTTWAEAASKKVAECLSVPEGHPMLVVQRVYFARSGRPLEMAVTHSPGDILRNEADLERVKD